MQQVLGDDSDVDNINPPAELSERFFVILNNDTPRWIIPENSQLGRRVLAQWRPYKLTSQVKWSAVRLLYSLNLISKLPGVIIYINEMRHRVKIPNEKIGAVPVIYVGTPGNQQKAVVTLVNPVTGMPMAVMKVALGISSSTSLVNEAKTLQRLNNAGVKNIPKLLSSELKPDRTWQTVISGQLSSRRLTANHIDWLLKLPKPGKTTSFDNQRKALVTHITNTQNEIHVQHFQIIFQAVNNIQGQHNVPLITVHGDFAPWNIKQTPDELAIIDWEDAEMEGLPLWDLCHFHFIQAHLFSDNNKIKSLYSDPLITRYLEGIGLHRRDHRILVLLYLLFKVITKNGNTSDDYKDFLIKQISTLCEHWN